MQFVGFSQFAGKRPRNKCVENQQQLLDIKLKLKIAVAVVQFELQSQLLVFLWQTDDERIKMQQMRHQKRLRKSERKKEKKRKERNM